MCIPCPFIPSPKQVSEEQRKLLTSRRRKKKASIKIFQALEYFSFLSSANCFVITRNQNFMSGHDGCKGVETVINPRWVLEEQEGPGQQLERL